MTRPNPIQPDAIEARIAKEHFTFVGASDMRELLGFGSDEDDWLGFAASWDALPEDTFMADGGRYRRRRHAAFSVARSGTIQPKPAQPHYQSRDRNPLNGGIERWFEPVLAETVDCAAMRSIFQFCQDTLGHLRPEVRTWHAEMHQFRILAQPDAPGQPTPEGMHRDGVDFVLVLLIQRKNVRSGTTSIANLDRQVLGEFTLREPLDAALVDDRFVFHGVTAIAPEDIALPAHRDVLVLTWKADPQGDS